MHEVSNIQSNLGEQMVDAVGLLQILSTVFVMKYANLNKSLIIDEVFD